VRATALLLALAACGEPRAELALEIDPLPPGLEIVLEIEREGAHIDTVRLERETYQRALAPGPYTLRATAYGPLDDTPRAALYRGELVVEAGPVEMTLAPLAAGVDLRATTPDPCTALHLEVEGPRPFALTLACEPTRIHLSPGRHRLRVEARSAAGFVLARFEQERVFGVGLARFDAALAPTGARLSLAFTLERARAQIECGDAGLDTLTATVRSDEGTLVEPLPCALDRARALIGARFPPGAALQIQLSGDGEDHFERAERLLMPSEDLSLSLRVPAVGAAIARWGLVETSECHGRPIEQWDVLIGDQMSSAPSFSRAYPAEVREAAVESLAYGEYVLVVTGRIHGERICQARERVRVAARENAWPTLEP